MSYQGVELRVNSFNIQKKDFVFNKMDIKNNNDVFKLAVNCKRHKLMDALQKEHYNKDYKFSIITSFYIS